MEKVFYYKMFLWYKYFDNYNMKKGDFYLFYRKYEVLNYLILILMVV